jgi:hypothetical protein
LSKQGRYKGDRRKGEFKIYPLPPAVAGGSGRECAGLGSFLTFSEVWLGGSAIQRERGQKMKEFWGKRVNPGLNW